MDYFEKLTFTDLLRAAIIVLLIMLIGVAISIMTIKNDSNIGECLEMETHYMCEKVGE